MNSVNLQLEPEDYDQIARYAESLGVSVEDVAGAALSRLMRVSHDHEVQNEIAEVRHRRSNSHMPWGGSAGLFHVVENRAGPETSRIRFL
jgi:hypothetical protein